MKKEIFLSCIIHIIVLGIYPAILLSKRAPSYPVNVYQVSILTLPPAQPPTSVIAEPVSKAKAPKKTKKAPKKTTRTQAKSPISTQQADFRYSYYLDIILSRIGENWRNPCEGEAGKISAVVYFIIHRDGTIEKVKLDKTSRNYYFDQAALRAVRSTKRLPPLPQEFERGWLGVYFEFEYVQ